VRIAFADPPYPGEARKHYLHHPDYAGEVDHAALIARLVDEYPDGWALSTKSTSLRDLLPLCPPDVRVVAWVKPFCSFKPGVPVAYAWEPVIWRGGRKRRRDQPTVRDWVSAVITLRRGTHGAKPEAFCQWLFALLGLEQGDHLEDIYPGSGAVGAAWLRYQTSMFALVGA
jgi:hypothetical protein